MEVRRTVPVALNVDSDDAALLKGTVDTLLWSAQYVVDHAFQGEHVTTSKAMMDDENLQQRARVNRRLQRWPCPVRSEQGRRSLQKRCCTLETG
jgi:hypothetical protein